MVAQLWRCDWISRGYAQPRHSTKQLSQAEVRLNRYNIGGTEPHMGLMECEPVSALSQNCTS